MKSNEAKYIKGKIVGSNSYSKYTFKTLLSDITDSDLVVAQTVNGFVFLQDCEYTEKPNFECRPAFQKLDQGLFQSTKEAI